MQNGLLCKRKGREASADRWSTAVECLANNFAEEPSPDMHAGANYKRKRWAATRKKQRKTQTFVKTTPAKLFEAPGDGSGGVLRLFPTTRASAGQTGLVREGFYACSLPLVRVQGRLGLANAIRPFLCDRCGW